MYTRKTLINVQYFKFLKIWFEIKPRNKETVPALVYVAATNGVRCIKVPHPINFNHFKAASKVKEGFCFL